MLLLPSCLPLAKDIKSAENDMTGPSKVVRTLALHFKNITHIAFKEDFETRCWQVILKMRFCAKAIIQNRSIDQLAFDKLLKRIDKAVLFIEENLSPSCDTNKLKSCLENIYHFLVRLKMHSDYDSLCLFTSDIQAAIAKALPAISKSDLQSSLAVLKSLHQNCKPKLYEFIAKWIDYNKIPIAHLPITSCELKYIEPKIHYLNLLSAHALPFEFSFDPFCNVTHLSVKNLSLKGLRWPPNLTSLSLKQCKIDAEAFSCLKNLVKVKMLSCMQITPRVFASLSQLKSLQVLSLLACKEVMDSHLKLLAANSELLKLNLSQCENITQQGVVSCLEHFPKLKIVNLSQCEKILDVVFAFTHLFENVKELHLSHCRGITDIGLKCIFSLKALKLLDISHHPHLTDKGFIQPLEAQGLEYLDIACCKEITDGALEGIKHFSRLLYLDVSGCEKLTNISLKHLSAFNSLKFLGIKGCAKITDEGLIALQSHPYLKEIDAANCTHITQVGIKGLSSLKYLSALNLLGCREVNFTLRAIPNFNHLKILGLANCRQVDDLALKDIGKILTLEKLNLSYCPYVTDEGVANLKEIKKLKEIDLSGCSKITDISLKLLAGHTFLISIDIEACDLISDVGIAYLKTLNNLQRLNIAGLKHLSESMKNFAATINLVNNL